MQEGERFLSSLHIVEGRSLFRIKNTQVRVDIITDKNYQFQCLVLMWCIFKVAELKYCPGFFMNWITHFFVL